MNHQFVFYQGLTNPFDDLPTTLLKQECLHQCLKKCDVHALLGKQAEQEGESICGVLMEHSAISAACIIV